MPGLHHSPRPAFLSGFDARTWSGVANVLRVSATDVALPTYGVGEGFYEDVLDFLNGRGSLNVATVKQTLGGLITEGWPAAASVVTVTINSSDRVTISSDTIDFAITASSNLAHLGFTSTTYAAVGGSAPFVRTAETNWTRGVVGPFSITVDPAGAGLAFTVTAGHVQSVPTWIRAHDAVDADGMNATANLERRVREAGIGNTYRFGLTDEDFTEGPGHVYISYPVTNPAPTWPNASFAARLGFRGDEAEQNGGAFGFVVGTYQCPGVFVPAYGLRRLVSWHDEITHAVAMTSGALASNHVSRWTGWEVEAFAHGEVATTDHEYHLRDMFWRYAPIGQPLNLYLHWGETRRQLPPQGATAAQAAYDLLYTTEKRRGRLRCYRDLGSESRNAMQWESDYYLRAPLRVSLRDRP